MNNHTDNELPRKILWVEDNLANIRLMQEAFQDMQVHKLVYVVQDGEQALAFLHRTPKDASHDWPVVVEQGRRYLTLKHLYGHSQSQHLACSGQQG